MQGLTGSRPYLPDNHKTAPLARNGAACQGRAGPRRAYRRYEQQQVGKRQVGEDPPRANQPLQVLDNRARHVGSVPDKLGQCCHSSPPVFVLPLTTVTRPATAEACPMTIYGGPVRARHPGRGHLLQARARWLPRSEGGRARTAGSPPF